jgi:hypothetical protein
LKINWEKIWSCQGNFVPLHRKTKNQGDMSRKFKIDGREYEGYELTNDELIRLIEDEKTSCEDLLDLTKILKERFKHNLCPKKGEDGDDVFARFFGNYVNGRCHDKKKVAKLMCNEHRYLQNEMFLLFMKFVEKLCEDAKKGNYDGRNQYACNTAKIIINALDARDWPH